MDGVLLIDWSTREAFFHFVMSDSGWLTLSLVYAVILCTFRDMICTGGASFSIASIFVL